MHWFYDSSLGTGIRESFWFPGIECVHVLAITNVFGAIMILDTRLLGIASKNRPITELRDDVLPWTWASFVVAVITGSLLFISRAVDYYPNAAFRAKIALIAAAGINMTIFEFTTGRTVQRWDTASDTPMAAKIAGGLSIILWIGVILCGRYVGWTAS